MKAMVIDRFGGAEELRVADMPVPEVPAGHLLVCVAYASINPADWKTRAGLLPVMDDAAFPLIIGMDCSGVVEKVGEGVTAFAPGDKVITLSGMANGQQGTYAEYACVPEIRTLPLPKGLSFAEGATIPIASASAASSIIDVAGAKAGDRVFLNGGAGSVGTFGIQYLKYIGCSVAATCSTRNISHVRLMGADLVIDYTKEDIGDELRAWAPEGLDSVIDAVGQNSLPRETPDWIKPGGTLVMIQNLLTGIDAFDLEGAAARNVRVVDNVRAAMPEDRHRFQIDAWRKMVAAIDRGAVQVPPYEVLPLEQAAEAQRRVEDGHVRGKILLRVGQL